MKLNGWHRLWILLSALYFVLVASFVILNFPKAENIPHQAEFYKKLSKKSAGMITSNNIKDVLALGHEIITDFKPVTGRWVDEEQIIEMPNKHIIVFKAKLSEEDKKIASQEYWRIVEQKATEQRLHFLFNSFLFWLAPCLVLYAFGWSISWVYKGFKQKKNSQQ